MIPILAHFALRFASSARKFEMQQRLIRMGHGEPTAAVAAVATAVAAATAAVAAVPSGPLTKRALNLPGGGGSCTNKLATGADSTKLDIGQGSEASLAQFANSTDPAGAIGMGISAAASPSPASVFGFSLSERLLIPLPVIMATSYSAGGLAGAQSSQPPHSSSLPSRGFRRSSMTGLYPDRTSPPPGLFRRSLGGLPQEEITLGLHSELLVPVAGTVATASKSRTVSHAGASLSAMIAGHRPLPRTGGFMNGGGGGFMNGGGFMRRFQRASWEAGPPKWRSERNSATAAAAAAVGLHGTYGGGQPLGEVRRGIVCVCLYVT